MIFLCTKSKGGVGILLFQVAFGTKLGVVNVFYVDFHRKHKGRK